MFKFFKRKQNSTLASLHGQEVKYVTKRVSAENGGVKEEIVGKSGRIVVINGIITIMCGETDVFKGDTDSTDCYTLLSGNGITVSGINMLNGVKVDFVVYYKYHRK